MKRIIGYMIGILFISIGFWAGMTTVFNKMASTSHHASGMTFNRL